VSHRFLNAPIRPPSPFLRPRFCVHLSGCGEPARRSYTSAASKRVGKTPSEKFVRDAPRAVRRRIAGGNIGEDAGGWNGPWNALEMAQFHAGTTFHYNGLQFSRRPAEAGRADVRMCPEMSGLTRNAIRGALRGLLATEVASPPSEDR
jgi:hypothetical protein